MRTIIVLAAMALAGCNANQPIYSSSSDAMTSSKPAQAVASCVTERFMAQNLQVSSADLSDGKVVMASADGQVAVRAEVRHAGAGSRVSLSSDWLLRSTYEPLARSCL